MEKNIQELKEQLSEIDFYKRFPIMIPFIGEHYLSDQHKKLLLVGESFYFPKKSEIHKNADIWYNATQEDLGVVIEEGKPAKEKEWINCDGLLRSDWKSSGHKIYININAAIREKIPHYHKRPIDEIAYTNFFVRPAIKGQMFKNYKKNGSITVDIKYANMILETVIGILNPDLLVFVSKDAFDMANIQQLKNNPNLDVEFVCHPADPFHWGVKTYKHNRDKFLRILEEKFLI